MRRLMILGLIVFVSACSSDSDAPMATGSGGSVLASSTFDEDLDGWRVDTHPNLFGTVTWLDREGGIVKLDGVGFDGLPNAGIHKDVDLPANAKTLRISTSAHDRNSGAVSLRVRLIDENQTEHTILDWESMSTGDEGFEFIAQTFDISSYAGQRVTLFLEIADIDGGGNNQRYIDYVEVHS